jgi:chromosome segregation ATPase
MNRIPQDAPQNFKQGPSLEEQVESLEQALSIQISKRIEAEHRLKSIHTIQSDLSDLEDILDSFISEIDGLDGDDSEALMERKDILWFIHEIKHRVKDITSNLSSSPVDSNVVEEEKNIAKLQGHVSSMKETIEKLTKNGEFQSMEESASAYDKFQMAQEHYNPTENRRGAALKEMQESLSEKNKEILILKQQLEQCTCRNHTENGHDVFHHETETTNVPSPGDFEESPSQNGNDRPNFNSPRRDSLIQSLKEDVEERDKIIDDLRTELDTYIQAKQPVEQQCSQSQEPSTRIRYLERIIRELEQKLSPNGRYGTIGFYAPEPFGVDDLELQIAELTERLQEQKLIENKRNSLESPI